MKNKLTAILLSAAIAFALWLYVITVVSPGYEDTYYNIPVVLQNEAFLESQGFMITTEELPTVTLHLSGNRSDLSKLNSSNIIISADLSKIYETGIKSLDYAISYPGDVSDGAVTVQSKYPSTITLEVEQKIGKEIPVEVAYNGSVSADYIADTENDELSHATVSVSGPKSVIDQIAQARIDVDLEGRTVSFSESYRFTLCDANGDPVDAEHVTTNVAEVNVTLYIQRLKEIPLKLEILSGGGATEQTSEITMEFETLKIAGNDTVLEDIQELVLGTVDLGALTEDTELTFPITLPAGVTNVTGREEVKVSVKFPDLITKNFKVTTITPINVPAGLNAEIHTKELTVTVRGDRKLMESMTEEHVSATVDLSNATAGAFTTNANVVMASGYSQVGAMGTYTVSVTLQPSVEAASIDANGADAAA